MGLAWGALGMLPGCSSGTASPSGDFSYTLGDWTGDSFDPMHRIRDGLLPPVPAPSRFADVVIVGGGLSGLTAAYQLRDENILVLEREDTLGGNAKQGVFRGTPYALGSAYLVDLEAPYGPLYEALHLPLKPVPSPADMVYVEGQWSPLEQGLTMKAFESLQAHFRTLLQSPDFPGVPIAEATPMALKLDQMRFSDYLEPLVDKPLRACIDAYCYSALGAGIQEVSAYAGVNFYSEIVGPIYAFPGGNSMVVQRLQQRIEAAGTDRLQSGVSVYQIQRHGNHVRTAYFHNAEPKHPVTVESKAVILAVPYFFAARLINDLPESARQVMTALQYGSYLVANCCFDRRVFQGGYDHWTPQNPVYTDFIVADHTVSQKQADRFVLTVYAPFRHALRGRMQLLQGNQAALAQPIAKTLQAQLGFPKTSLQEIRMTRYGHQLLSSRVGIVQALNKLPKRFDRIALAHSDGQGMASIESAITEAMTAATWCRDILALS